VAAELMAETLAGLAAGTLKPRPQDESQATYAPLLAKAQGRIDWTLPARMIANRVRAFEPWPGAYTFCGQDQLKIKQARPEPSAGSEPPGTILRADKDGVLVACGEGALLALSLQPPGKRPMKAGEYLAGHCLEPGNRFS